LRGYAYGMADERRTAVSSLVEESPYRFRIPRHGAMRVPGVVFASRSLLPEAGSDQALEQVANVATLPGIVAASYAMPDVHWGYGFPIGGVAATDVDAGGVVSPGGVGFDISCGVRLLAADATRDELGHRLPALADALAEATPRGMGPGAVWELAGPDEMAQVLTGGSRYAVERGHGVERDLSRCEDFGAVPEAEPGLVGERAMARGLAQLGSLGSGNHFLEVQAVEEVVDGPTATAFGLRPGQLCVMIHCGSRGLGHQLCTDHLRAMEAAMPEYDISVPDRQLACAPVDSAQGREYLAAMAAAANYARANRQLLGQAARRVFAKVLGRDLDLVYDVSHNLAKLETHSVDGRELRLCVHRKGATRALPPGHADLPGDLRAVGQPVLIPGTMGTASYLLSGVTGGEAFASTCHGAGRALSRHQAAKTVRGRQLRDRLHASGIEVRGDSWRGLAEETPEAYKDVAAVVEAAEAAGLCRSVARLVPVAVIKG
jgi:tRNA-splicing ligase RtcB (3'-phosphate/5'-hydroxy nucleic acid ligase)